MGNLLKILARDEASCCSLPKNDVFVDFETASPTPDEAELYDEAERVLLESKDIIKTLVAYKGATKEIREAITTPSSENEARAWETLMPLVLQMKTFYEFSVKLQNIVPKIMHNICQGTSGPVVGSIADQLDDHQALVKQLAKLLDFVLKFDEEKMMKSALQNDFSYYRRTTQRNRNSVNMAVTGDAADTPSFTEQAEEQVPLTVANKMSLFFAQATPMLHTLSTAVSDYVSNKKIEDMATEMLCMMTKVCQKMLEIPELKSRFQYEETELFILRVMVATIILYDHIHPSGAFVKGSRLDVKGCVKILREQDKSRSESLLNALRYTTRHLNEDTTPKSTKSLLFEEMS